MVGWIDNFGTICLSVKSFSPPFRLENGLYSKCYKLSEKDPKEKHKYFPLGFSVNFLPPPTDWAPDVPEYILFVVNNANICFSPRQGLASKHHQSRSQHPHQQLRRSGASSSSFQHQDRGAQMGSLDYILV